jgi:hypothetical protein
MKFPFQKKSKEPESREVVERRLNTIKKGAKAKALTNDVPKLVRGLAESDN